ncbi:MAG TPA: polysaccharide biosynthesis/export family protein [Acidisarcina sp.]
MASASAPAPTSDPSAPRSAAPNLTWRPASEHPFHVGAGDVLNITVWEEPQLTTKAVVRPDGFISMPLVDDVSVTGLTPEQIQVLLTERVGRIVKRPRVSVVVEEIHSRLVYITGEVQHPGAYPLIENINVAQLIARSGGPTEYAHKHKVFVLRQETRQKLKVDYENVLKGRNVEQNIALLPGDMVVIP